MDKYDQIEALYARRSELNLTEITLENKIVSSPSTDRIGLLKQLRDIHFQQFMMEYEIKAVLEPEKKSIWNLITQFSK